MGEETWPLRGGESALLTPVKGEQREEEGTVTWEWGGIYLLADRPQAASGEQRARSQSHVLGSGVGLQACGGPHAQAHAQPSLGTCLPHGGEKPSPWAPAPGDAAEPENSPNQLTGETTKPPSLGTGGPLSWPWDVEGGGVSRECLGVCRGSGRPDPQV